MSERDPAGGRRGEPEVAARPAPDPASEDGEAARIGTEADPDGHPDAPAGEAEAADVETPRDTEEPQPAGAEKDPLTRAEEERAEYLALAQRTKADFENYRRRAARDAAAADARGRAGVVRELLPVIDSLERALEAAGEVDGALEQGVRLVHSELAAILERNGVEPIDPAGEPFDPNVHEALSTRAENGTEAGVVLDVVQRGYRLEESVLRPARVVVSA